MTKERPFKISLPPEEEGAHKPPLDIYAALLKEESTRNLLELQKAINGEQASISQQRKELIDRLSSKHRDIFRTALIEALKTRAARAEKSGKSLRID